MDELVKSINKCFIFVVIFSLISLNYIYYFYLIGQTHHVTEFMNKANEAIEAVRTISKSQNPSEYEAHMDDYYLATKDNVPSIHPPEYCRGDSNNKIIHEECKKYKNLVAQQLKNFPKGRVFIVKNISLLSNECWTVLIRKSSGNFNGDIISKQNGDDVQFDPQNTYLATVQCGDRTTTESFIIDDLSTNYKEKIRLEIRGEYWNEYLSVPYMTSDFVDCHDSKEFFDEIPFYDTHLQWTRGCYFGDANTIMAKSFQEVIEKSANKPLGVGKDLSLKDLLLFISKYKNENHVDVSLSGFSGIRLHVEHFLLLNALMCYFFLFVLYSRSVKISKINAQSSVPSIIIDNSSRSESILRWISYAVISLAPIICAYSIIISFGLHFFIPKFSSLFSFNRLIVDNNSAITSKIEFFMDSAGFLVVIIFFILMLVTIKNFRTYSLSQKNPFQLP
ncbi:hypothetical protein [Desulfovibrio desulfuricans]|uniref:hypothetical protein n=1 Tax=Desulfovibrio desulfuricans TaxID=876 RepID=UPI001C035D67|nr:hypothetical protein [Desulfovibrio desulfuricans]MBT9748623.1 hypothetical protein [Desulfovibrio desulfuricans]